MIPFAQGSVKGETMSRPEVYQQTKAFLAKHLLDPYGRQELRAWVLDRLTLLALGIIQASNAAPAKIAEAGEFLSGGSTTAESAERRLRRIVRDERLQARTCLHPLARRILSRGGMDRLVLILDPSLQEDRVVLVRLNVWYRGRSLPLVWTTWPANRPLEGERFWERIAALLAEAQPLLPEGVAVVVLADRAFGTPAFTDLVAQHGWHWIVRVQGQTRCRDRCGREQSVVSLVARKGQRCKLRGQAFKKAGWREASLVAYWGPRHRAPLCLVSDLPPEWTILAEYRQRFGIEPSFRDEKIYGWHWEQIQVRCLSHLNVLLVGMALASWLTLLVGALRARVYLARPPTGRRHTRPWAARYSLFQLGLRWWRHCLAIDCFPLWEARLPDWQAPNWSNQLTARQVYAFIFT
jgi:hypothetical protein